jgi:cyclopropane fatty-acyl-phospholipid synthase-like methyltransferase
VRNKVAGPSFYGEMSRLMPDGRYAKPQFVEFMKRIVVPGSSVLDVGCGIGVDSELLATELSTHVSGFDSSVECVLRATERGVPAVVASWDESWPFVERFDLVLAAFVVHQVSNLFEFFSRCAAVLKSGGRVAVLTASHDDIERRFLTKYFPASARVDSVRYPPVDEVKRSMSAVHLGDIEVHSVVVRTETVSPEYLRVVRERLWSSLRLISDEEFQTGLNEFDRAIVEWERDGSFPEWENRKTLILARRA